jgi:hypothetical protein
MIGKERFFAFGQVHSIENRISGKNMFPNVGRKLPATRKDNCLICRKFFGYREERNSTMPSRHRLVTRFDWTALLPLFTFQPLPMRSAPGGRLDTDTPFVIHA